MITISESSFVESPTRPNGERTVVERHVDSAGSVHTYEWTGTQDAGLVLSARAEKLNELLAAREAAQALVAGTLLSISKLKFREHFTFVERMGIDALHATFESHPTLTAEQKSALRTALKDYEVAENIARPFDARVSQMLTLYVALGLLSAERMTAIIEAGNV